MGHLASLVRLLLRIRHEVSLEASLYSLFDSVLVVELV